MFDMKNEKKIFVIIYHIPQFDESTINVLAQALAKEIKILLNFLKTSY